MPLDADVTHNRRDPIPGGESFYYIDVNIKYKFVVVVATLEIVAPFIFSTQLPLVVSLEVETTLIQEKQNRGNN